MSIRDLLADLQSIFWKSKVNDKFICTFNIIQFHQLSYYEEFDVIY